MPHYILLRVQREDHPTERDQGVVKFFPVKDKDGKYVTIQASDDSTAWGIARIGRGNALPRHLAIEPLDLFTARLARFAADKAARIRRGSENGGAAPAGRREHGEPVAG